MFKPIFKAGLMGISKQSSKQKKEESIRKHLAFSDDDDGASSSAKENGYLAPTPVATVENSKATGNSTFPKDFSQTNGQNVFNFSTASDTSELWLTTVQISVVCFVIYLFYCYFDLCVPLLLLCVAVSFFSWSIIYFDSFEPGLFPPTPTSPAHLRKKSGHAFHLSYVMSVINGIILYVTATWWLNSRNILV